MLNFISAEIENPFGDDANDLDRIKIQATFNRTLVTMLSPGATHIPLLRDKDADSEIMLIPEKYKNADNYSNAWARRSEKAGRQSKVHAAHASMLSLYEDFNHIVQEDQKKRATKAIPKEHSMPTPKKEPENEPKLIGATRVQIANPSGDSSYGIEIEETKEFDSGEETGGGDKAKKKMKKKAAPQPVQLVSSQSLSNLDKPTTQLLGATRE